MNRDKLVNINTGFVSVEPQPGDFIAGAETGILNATALDSGDWRAFLPTNATQLMKTSDGMIHGDTNACVSFAGGQSVETQLNHQIATGKVSSENLKWLSDNGYLDSNGVFLSKRFTAKMSGTNPSVGNSLPNVWASLKKHGAVPEGMWPMPTSGFGVLQAQGITDINKYWNEYYATIPQFVIDLGKEFASRFPILYEWIVYIGAPASGQKLLEDLTVSPMEIATAVCPGWNTDDPIKACGPGTQHATLLTFVEADRYDILDHYVPYRKQFASDYTITYGMRGVVGQVLATPPVGFHFVFTKQLKYNEASNDESELTALQMTLQSVKSPVTNKPYMKPGVFGPFGPLTKAALGQFQTEHNIKDADGQGTNFGPASRTALNAALQGNK